MKWTEKNAHIYVDTGKEGALAAKGHDLRFSFESFEVSYDTDSRDMLVVVKTSSMSYLGVLTSTRDLDPDGLSASDQNKVQKTAFEKILNVEKYPNARFEANIPDVLHKAAISGKLTLCGKTRPVTFEADIDDSSVSASFTILQSEFGIKQYSALLGALKVADQVRISVSLDIKGLKTS